MDVMGAPDFATRTVPLAALDEDMPPAAERIAPAARAEAMRQRFHAILQRHGL
jgi:hypothetical protein